MPGVGLGHRSGGAGNQVAHQEAQSVCTAQPGSVEPEVGGQRLIDCQQSQVGKGFGLPPDSHLRQVAQEAVLQGNGRIRSAAHVVQTTESVSATTELTHRLLNQIAGTVEHRRERSDGEIQQGRFHAGMRAGRCDGLGGPYR